MRFDHRPLGFFVVLLPPTVLACGTRLGWPILAFALFVACSPITRYVFNVYRPGPLQITEGLAKALYALPACYLLVLTLAIVDFERSIPTLVLSGPLHVAAGALSLWTVMVFGLFPSHEMFHRRSPVWIRAGAIASGICGYPLWPGEHMAHHRSRGALATRDAAEVEQGPWTFTRQRLRSVLAAAIDTEKALHAHFKGQVIGPMSWATLAMVCTALSFWWFAGYPGICVYIISALGVTFAAQLMTYVQHWGLDEAELDSAGVDEAAWEDDCLMQAWLTLANSLHAAHHRDPEIPYFHLQPQSDSPRQPGCYVVMLVLCIVPGLWRKIMRPVREAYLQSCPTVCHPGRRVICIRPALALVRERQSNPSEDTKE